MFSRLAVVITVLLPVVSAQQPVWAQCGGIGFNGGTTCAAGSACTYSNDYYSQCLPSTATTPAPIQPPVVPSTGPAPGPTAAPTPPAPAPKGTPNYWFSFGDSYTQTGFSITDTVPAIGKPLGNPPYPGYTAVGGVNWIDLDTTKYNKSLVLTYNYAYGGATINASLVTPFQSTVLSLVDQVNQYLSTAAKKPATAPWTSQNSLFSVWIGINDIGNSYSQGGNRSAFAETLLTNYFSLVQNLYNTGARNFLFINVPPVDRSPLALANSASSIALWKNTILDFNSRLASHIASFKASNAGVTTYTWDSNTAFGKYLDAPKNYGFVDNVSYGSATNYFWGNNYHPSPAAHDLFAKEVAGVLANAIW